MSMSFQSSPPTDKPRLFFENDPVADQRCILYLDGVPITKCTTVLQGMSSLFAAYFVFNIKYEKQARNLCIFIESHILNMFQGKIPDIVTSFINLIEN